MDWLILCAALGFGLHGAKYAWRWQQKKYPWAETGFRGRFITVASMAITAVASAPLVPILAFAKLADIIADAGEDAK